MRSRNTGRIEQVGFTSSGVRVASMPRKNMIATAHQRRFLSPGWVCLPRFGGKSKDRSYPVMQRWRRLS
jgi:hypothetical protein